MMPSLWISCTLSEPPVPVPPRELVTVSSFEDYPRAQAALSDPTEGIVEILLQEGVYTVALELDARETPKEVIVRGVGDVRFERAPLVVAAREVEVTGITFSGTQTSAVLQIEVVRSARLRDLRLEEVRPFAGPRGPSGLIELGAAGPGAVASLSILQVIEGGTEPAPLIHAQQASPGSSWAKLSFEGGSVAAWSGTTVLSLISVREVELRGGEWVVPAGATLVEAQWPPGLSLLDTRLVIDSYAALGAPVRESSGTFFVRNGGSIGVVRSTPGAEEEALAIAGRLRTRP